MRLLTQFANSFDPDAVIFQFIPNFQVHKSRWRGEKEERLDHRRRLDGVGGDYGGLAWDKAALVACDDYAGHSEPVQSSCCQ